MISEIENLKNKINDLEYRFSKSEEENISLKKQIEQLRVEAEQEKEPYCLVPLADLRKGVKIFKSSSNEVLMKVGL